MPTSKRSYRILHVSSEVAPYSKSGGLGDVLGALPAHQRAEGHRARVITPLYGFIDRASLIPKGPLEPVWLGGTMFSGALWLSSDEHILFIDVPGLLDRPTLYGAPTQEYDDNALRFGVFCRFAAALSSEEDVVHLHDWQSGLTAVYLSGRRPTVQTIHNLAFQGLYSREWAPRLDIPEILLNLDGLEHFGGISFLKAGLVLANHLTTVSPTYAIEIQSEPGGMNLSGLFQRRKWGLSGIRNGIDMESWDPGHDPAIESNFTASRPAGRVKCEAALRAELGLGEGPVFGVVCRASVQKGLDLIARSASQVVELGGRFAILADGDPTILGPLRQLAQNHPTAVSLTSTFDLDLARRIYAGSHFVMVPSRFEPCGLTQMYGMRYGAIPIVRRTGGLADTVTDGETGLTFFDPTPEACFNSMKRALELYAQPKTFKAMRKAGMMRDWSWVEPSNTYSAVYQMVTAR